MSMRKLNGRSRRRIGGGVCRIVPNPHGAREGWWGEGMGALSGQVRLVGLCDLIALLLLRDYSGGDQREKCRSFLGSVRHHPGSDREAKYSLRRILEDGNGPVKGL